MKSVTIDKNELLIILEDNRDTHEAEYNDAHEGYLKACVDSLEMYLKKFKNNDCEQVIWGEFPPQSQVKDYNRVIRMLELSVDGEIELTSEEFANYVQDDWQWKQNWTLSNSKYMSVTSSV